MSLRENDTSVDEKAIEDGFPSIDVTSDIEVKEPPDGGWVAWLIVFGCFCVCMLDTTTSSGSEIVACILNQPQ